MSKPPRVRIEKQQCSEWEQETKSARDWVNQVRLESFFFFFQLSLHGAVIWICDGSIVNSVFAIAEHYLHYIKAVSVSHTALPVRRLGCTRSWEGTLPGQLTPTNQRNIPSHLIPSDSAIKAGGKQEEVWHLVLWHLSSQVTIKRDEALLSWKWLNVCLLMGTSDRILLCWHTALPH